MSHVESEPGATLDLLDYRRRVTELYAAARTGGPGREPWRRWVAARDELFATHPQTALDPSARASFQGLGYFPHDPSMRFEATVVPLEAAAAKAIDHSGDGATTFRPFGRVSLPLAGRTASLTLFWLEAYGGGVFVPFRDATAGVETYGGGRYLLDTVKGADLGSAGSSIVLDFNYAYHPSCVYSDRWSCPLAPEENRLTLPIRAGERLRSGE